METLAIIAHELVAAVTVDADQAFLAVNIGAQLVELKAVWPGLLLLGGERSAVFEVEVMFKTAVIVEAHPIAIMAGQTTIVIGFSEKGMAAEFTVCDRKMTGRAAGAVPGGGIVVAWGIKMAAQAAAAQHIVGQGLAGDWRFLDWYFCQVA